MLNVSPQPDRETQAGLRSNGRADAEASSERRSPDAWQAPALVAHAPANHTWCSEADRKLLLDARLHSERLAAAAAEALREERFEDALALADRRCRIGPMAEASHYLLRATAHFHLGDRELALLDIRKAIEIEPENDLTNRALLASRFKDERARAAKTLIRQDRRPKILADAISALDNQALHSIGALRPGLTGIQGWVVWRGNDALRLELAWDGETATVELLPEPSHELSEIFGSATDVTLEWPDGTQFVEVRAPGGPFLFLDSRLLRPIFDRCRSARCDFDRPPLTNCANRNVAVIVPIYKDYDATLTCLTALVDECRARSDRFIVVVDDASPDPLIRKLLDSLASGGDVRLMRNEQNLGFARSVNRALSALVEEDVLLLNADTVPPPGFLDRLRQAAYSAEGIATVTPLSNNGEYTSFPVPFRENELPSIEAVAKVDRIAAKINRGRVVDMPNGTGFCLYITRACVDRVGLFNTEFGRGYLEDVEFCLRASDAGLRNVCATNVFVGHAGSRSFQSDKRALVVRNLTVLQNRWPDYRSISAAFMAADPLRPAREAIELVAMKRSDPAELLIVGDATDTQLIEARVRDRQARGAQVMIGSAALRGGRILLHVRRASGGLPQSVRFDHGMKEGEPALCDNFRSLPIRRVEFADLAATPAALVRALSALDIPYDIFASDVSLACARRAGAENGAHGCAACHGVCGLVGTKAIFDCELADETGARGSDLWTKTIAGADFLLTDDEQLASILAEGLGRPASTTTVARSDCCVEDRAVTRPPVSVCLGIVTDKRAAALSFIMNLARRLASSNIRIVVLGSTFDDLRAMQAGPVFVTGPVESHELPAVIRRSGISHLLFSDRRASICSEQLRAVHQMGLPTASFDSYESKLADGNLVLSRQATMREIAGVLLRWACDARKNDDG